MVKFKCEDLIDCVHKNLTVLDILSAVTINFTIEEVLPNGGTVGTLVKSTPYYEFNMTSGSTGVYITGIDDESCKCDLFDQIKESIKPGGMILIETYNIDYLRYASFSKKYLLEHNELLEIFKDFKTIRYQAYDDGTEAYSSIIAQKP